MNLRYFLRSLANFLFVYRTSQKAGAVSYLQKNMHSTEIEKALNSVSENDFYYPDQVDSRISNRRINNNGEFKLTDREIDFLKYCCTEMTYREIAEKMFCSPRTIESYRDALFEKLNVNTRMALALYAVRNGLYQL